MRIGRLVKCDANTKTHTLQLSHTPAHLLCEGLVLERCVVDLDDTLVLLEDILSLGATLFFDAFNVEAQSP